MSSRLNSILSNYDDYVNNQISSANEFKEQMENNQREAQNAETAGDENSLDMMALHFFGDKIKNFISEKLGLNTDEINKFTDNPTEYMKNATKDVLNKASDTLQEQLEQRGLTPEGLMQRTENITRDGIDTLRRRLLDDPDQEEDAEEMDEIDDTTGTTQPDAPEAVEPLATGPRSATSTRLNLDDDDDDGPTFPPPPPPDDEEEEAEDGPTFPPPSPPDEPEQPPTVETLAEDAPEPVAEPVAEPVSTAPFGGVRMPGSEELQARFQSQISTPETASDAGQKLVTDITNHMRATGEDDLADRITRGRTSAQEVTTKLQEQMDDQNDIIQPNGTARNASQLLERAQNLPESEQPPPSQAASQAAEEASEAAADVAADAAISDELLLAV